jgi:hypothetical protein
MSNDITPHDVNEPTTSAMVPSTPLLSLDALRPEQLYALVMAADEALVRPPAIYFAVGIVLVLVGIGSAMFGMFAQAAAMSVVGAGFLGPWLDVHFRRGHKTMAAVLTPADHARLMAATRHARSVLERHPASDRRAALFAEVQQRVRR